MNFYNKIRKYALLLATVSDVLIANTLANSNHHTHPSHQYKQQHHHKQQRNIVDIVLVSNVDEANNHLVNVLQVSGDSTRLVSSTNSRGLMDWNQMMLNVGSRSTFNSQGGLASE
eukprot:Pgem_evm1s4956